MKIDPVYKKFTQQDGRILMEADKLLYGYKEADFFWYKLLIAMFTKHGYGQSFWDPYLVFKHGASGSRAEEVGAS